jgi:hypothetical protein
MSSFYQMTFPGITVNRVEKKGKGKFTQIFNHIMDAKKAGKMSLPKLKPTASRLLQNLILQKDGWDFSVRDMADRCVVGKDAIRAAMKQLVLTGYLKIFRLMDEKTGRFLGSHYLVSETAEYREENKFLETMKSICYIVKVSFESWASKTFLPYLDKPNVVKPDLEKTYTSNTEAINTDIYKNTTTTAEPQKVVVVDQIDIINDEKEIQQDPAINFSIETEKMDIGKSVCEGKDFNSVPPSLPPAPPPEPEPASELSENEKQVVTMLSGFNFSLNLIKSFMAINPVENIKAAIMDGEKREAAGLITSTVKHWLFGALNKGYTIKQAAAQGSTSKSCFNPDNVIVIAKTITGTDKEKLSNFDPLFKYSKVTIEQRDTWGEAISKFTFSFINKFKIYSSPRDKRVNKIIENFNEMVGFKDKKAKELGIFEQPEADWPKIIYKKLNIQDAEYEDYLIGLNTFVSPDQLKELFLEGIKNDPRLKGEEGFIIKIISVIKKDFIIDN